jgi:ribosome-interacting GTPase 1
MIRTAPKHKSSEKLLGDLRKRLSKLKKEMKKEQSAQASGKPRFSIRKEGAAQVCIIGFTNSGKSSLLKSLTNANVEIADYEYTTSEPEVGMMDHTGVKIQLVEIPSTFSSDAMSLVKTCDLVLILLDGNVELTGQLYGLVDILEKNGITEKRIVVAVNSREGEVKSDPITISANGDNFDGLKGEIWSRLDLIRVFTKSPNRSKADRPLTLKKGSTVKDVTEQVHKTMLDNFRFARIFDGSKHSGRKVGLEYELSDMDVVEIHSG